MADYIYLLENRLSPAQRDALVALRGLARAKGLTLFLVGGAVRDLTSGSPVRDLDVAVQGNALKLRKDVEAAGAVVAGTNDSLQALYVRFPGGVRVEVGSTMTATYPKPGKPVLKPGTILEDLRRRDFTANAMALSLNEGSYGLLMDPLNGVADIENRELRLVSNYGFIEEPVRLIRAARFSARLGWTLEEKTQTRYETGKQEGYAANLTEFHKGYEAEEIVHEEDPLRVMRRLEAEGWMQTIAPAWNSSKANVTELEKVRESQTQLQMQGIHPDAAAVNFPLLTAKMAADEVTALKKSFPRPGFAAEIDALEGEAKEFATQLGAKAAATASVSYKLIQKARPEAVLYVAYTTKSGTLQAKFKSFFGDWQQARQKIPLTLMGEMRIVPELAGYQELLEKLFFELMDGRLTTTEEMKAFLEPYSPPAPPPPVHLRRARAARKDAKKSRAKKGAALVADETEDLGEDDDLDDANDANDDPDAEDEAGDEVEALGGADLLGADSLIEAELAGVTPAEVAEAEGVSDDAADDDEDVDEAPEEEVAPPAKARGASGGKTAKSAKSAKGKRGSSDDAEGEPAPVESAPGAASAAKSRRSGPVTSAEGTLGKVVVVKPAAVKAAAAKAATGVKDSAEAAHSAVDKASKPPAKRGRS